MAHQHGSHNDGKTPTAARWVFVGFILIAGYLLVMEHKAHLSGWLSSYGIWLLLLACPLMHLFMHGGHDSHGSGNASNQSITEKK